MHVMAPGVAQLTSGNRVRFLFSNHEMHRLVRGTLQDNPRLDRPTVPDGRAYIAGIGTDSDTGLFYERLLTWWARRRGRSQPRFLRRERLPNRPGTRDRWRRRLCRRLRRERVAHGGPQR